MFFKEKWNGQNFACVIDGFKASSKRNCENERRKRNSGRDMEENERGVTATPPLLVFGALPTSFFIERPRNR